jgi:Domain of unknown function (DUF4157)
MDSSRQPLTSKSASAKTTAPGRFLQRQCACGNRTIIGGQCAECAKKKSGLQRKLTIGASNDPLELEADLIADRVMASSANSVVSSAPPRIQRFTGQTTGQADMTAPDSVDSVLSSPGSPLEPGLQEDMGQRFGHDFSQVRVHTDAAADRSAQDVNANAYTVGQDIVFSAGQFAPNTNKGQRLIAHELMHVVQQHTLRMPHNLSRKMGDEKENEVRAKLLTEFTDGAGLPEQQVKQIAAAMRGFSIQQLQIIKTAGVRFWAQNSLPPEFNDRVSIKNLSKPARYIDLVHIIQVTETATTDQIRHELAHAWDHVRTGKVKPIGQLKDKAFEKAIKDTPALSSMTDEKRPTKEIHNDKVRKVRMPISEMLKKYKERAVLREHSFDNPSTKESYSKTSSREFYAEGYSVFHGGREWNQARLLYYAPELYELLEIEAKHGDLDIPDRSKLETARKEQNLIIED